MALTEERLREVAEHIAQALFTNGFGQCAQRIALKDAQERDLGGYCFKAAVAVIEAHLPAEYEPGPKRERGNRSEYLPPRPMGRVRAMVKGAL